MKSRLEIKHNGTTYTEVPNDIGIEFTDGVIDKVVGISKGVHYILLISAKAHLFIRTKSMRHYPSKDFIKAVKSSEFKCRYTMLNNAGYSCH